MSGLERGAGRHALQVHSRPGAVCLQLGSPGRAPELSPDLLAALLAQLQRLHTDERVLLLRGQPDGFCMGMDLELVANWPAGHSTRELHAGFAAVLEALRRHPVTTVALVEGDAMGGGLALAAACDLVVALKPARFALPELLWGLQPAHALPFVVRRMGMAAARRLALLTEPIDAGQAREQGLVDFVVDDVARLEGLVRRLTLRAARMPPGAAAQLRQLFEVLEHERADYPARALDCITSITDDAGFRQRLAARYVELLEEVKHE